jgi:hypothetical protein
VDRFLEYYSSFVNIVSGAKRIVFTCRVPREIQLRAPPPLQRSYETLYDMALSLVGKGTGAGVLDPPGFPDSLGTAQVVTQGNKSPGSRPNLNTMRTRSSRNLKAKHS